MNKTITALALLASASSAHALIGPNPTHEPLNTACVALYKGEGEAAYLGDCDQTKNNKKQNLEVNESGCPDGQAKFESYDVKLPNCMPIGIVQL